MLDHVLQLASQTYTVFDKDLIPTGEIAPVAGTPLDFTKPNASAMASPSRKRPAARPAMTTILCLPGKPGQLAQAAKIVEPVSGRVMTVRTDQTGMQVYTANGNAICFETQHHPNSVNIPQFASTILRPGETYRSTTIFGFAIQP